MSLVIMGTGEAAEIVEKADRIYAAESNGGYDVRIRGIRGLDDLTLQTYSDRSWADQAVDECRRQVERSVGSCRPPFQVELEADLPLPGASEPA